MTTTFEAAKTGQKCKGEHVSREWSPDRFEGLDKRVAEIGAVYMVLVIMGRQVGLSLDASFYGKSGRELGDNEKVASHLCSEGNASYSGVGPIQIELHSAGIGGATRFVDKGVTPSKFNWREGGNLMRMGYIRQAGTGGAKCHACRSNCIGVGGRGRSKTYTPSESVKE